MWQLSYPTANDVSEGRYLGQKVNFSLKYSLFVICYKKFLLRERERERERCTLLSISPLPLKEEFLLYQKL